MLRRAAEHDAAGLAALDAAEADELVLADHDLVYELAAAELDALGVVERRDNVGAEHEREPLDALEVGVLDRRYARVGEVLPGRVVDRP